MDKVNQLISVVLPVYNAEKYLFETLESIVQQSYREIELIIINHASTDGSQDIIEQYIKNDSRLIVINLEQNVGGPAHPRNIGIAQSKGEYIAFIDADDIWEKDKIKKCMLLAKADIIYHKEIFFKNTLGNAETISNTKNYENEKNIFHQLLLNGNNFSPSAIMIKRTILKDNFFNESALFHTVEDYDLWLRLSRQNLTYKFINEVLGYYRLHDEAASKNIKIHGKNARNLIKYHFSEYSFFKNPEFKFIMYKKLVRSVCSNIYYTIKSKQKVDVSFYLIELVKIFKYPQEFEKSSDK